MLWPGYLLWLFVCLLFVFVFLLYVIGYGQSVEEAPVVQVGLKKKGNEKECAVRNASYVK